MIISVASGKGGTGKTTTAASLAKILPDTVYIDCDVEEPDGHIFLEPVISNQYNAAKKVPNIDYDMCNLCGKCAEICEFNALIMLKEEILIFDEMCHSCGACSFLCPLQAITEIDKNIGIIKTGKSGSTVFVEGILRIGEASPVSLINQVKNNIITGKVNIIDAPPGTSCSMVEAVKGSDYCILVTESTPYGLNDLRLAIDTVNSMNIPFGIIINKYDSSFSELDTFIVEKGYQLLMKIPYDIKLAENYSNGILPVEQSYYKELFAEMYIKIKNKIKKPVQNAAES